MPGKPPWAWAPNALSGSRVILTGLTWGAVLARDLPWFVVLVLVIILTDMYDGPIARRLGIASRTGANIDSLADLTFYASLPAWMYLFRPEEVLAHVVPIAIISALYLGSLVLGRIRRGAVGFHNSATRTAGTGGVLFGLWTILWGWTDWLWLPFVAVIAVDLALRYRKLLAPGARAAGTGATAKDD